MLSNLNPKINKIFVKKGEILAVGVLIILFLLAAWFANQYEEQLRFLIEGESLYWGMFIYFLLTTLAVVLAPISTFPLLPLAVSLFGRWPALWLSVFAWTFGAVIAFLLASLFGRPIIRRFFNLDKVDEIGRLLGTDNLFLSIFVLRMLVPVDVLSYAIGLFVRVPLLVYTLATFLGVIPFAIFFVFAVSFSLFYQIIALSFVFLIAWLGLYIFKKKRILKDDIIRK